MARVFVTATLFCAAHIRPFFFPLLEKWDEGVWPVRLTRTMIKDYRDFSAYLAYPFFTSQTRE